MPTPAEGSYRQPQNLTELLTVLDEFVRCRELPIAELLEKFLELRGSTHPAFHANNLIDHLSFTAAGRKPKHIGNQDNSQFQ